MKIYKLMIIDQIYQDGKAYGTLTKTVEVPFIPKLGMKIRKDGIQTNLLPPQKKKCCGSNWIECLPELVFDCDEKIFKYYGATNRHYTETEKYISLFISKGYSFEPYEIVKDKQ